MSRLESAIKAKIQKRKALQDQGVDIHPYSFDKQQTIEELIGTGVGGQAKTSGRIMAKRPHGKVVFLDLKDSTAVIQVMLRQDELSKKQFELLQHIDPGDFLGVSGEVIKTKAGELTIQAEKFKFLGKALRPIPTEWNAAEDKEVRFRQRYVDILINDDVRQILDTRWKILKEMRRFLQEKHNYTEVETPVLQAIYGGTNARPFSTNMNALDSDFYLRIAPELYLKRLIVGGYERIFEIARNFRNEGIDQTHQPEFTMIEWYQAYADYHTMMDIAEEMIQELTQVIHGSHEIMVGETSIDLSGSWPRIKMIDALQEFAEIDFKQLDDQAVKQLLTEHEIDLPGGYSRGKAMFNLFDKLVTDKLIQPVWIIDYPRDVSPLAKVHREDDWYCERFEAYVGGKELADGWSEVVDPIDQRNLFKNEQQQMRAGDEEAHPTDEDFLRALEYGLPPLGGIGMGIDRLVMFLTNTWSIKEVIAFPTLKPEFSQQAPRQPEKINNQKTDQGQEKAVKQKEDAQAGSSNTAAASAAVELPTREESTKLMHQYIKNKNLRHHCLMTAQALAAYAEKLGQNPELWYQTGLLHDLDWEKYPDEHPLKAAEELLTDYPLELIEAVRAHAPLRTKVEPSAMLDRYLFACDELSGFLYAYSLMRPKDFVGMKPSKVKKKLGDKSFAANISRDDINKGFDLIEEDADEHLEFLIDLFIQKNNT